MNDTDDRHGWTLGARARLAVLVALGTLPASSVACDSFGARAADAEPPGDAGDGGVTIDAEGDAAAACAALYVSAASGNDANSGCTPSEAKATIGAALAFASTVASPPEIKVCRGTYAELNLAITFPVALLGGYDCSAWTRAADYGYPSFSANRSTVIVPSTLASQGGTTLAIGPLPALDGGAAAEGRPFTVDGFTVQGPTTTTASSYAVAIEGPVSGLTLSNNQIIGGAFGGTTATTTALTRALYINGNAGVDVTKNVIGFGSSPSPTAGGAFGMWVTAGSVVPHIHGNKITGGLSTTKAPAGSIALWIRGPNPARPGLVGNFTKAAGTAIEDNVISGGTSTNGETYASAGINLNGAGQGLAADLLGNDISGGTGAAGAGNSSAVALSGNSLVSVTVNGNRLYGGTSTTSDGNVAAVSFSNIGQTTITNNLIHGGSTLQTSTASASTSGIACASCSGLTIADNTIFAGGNSQGLAPAFGILLSASADAKVLGNVLLGANNPSSGNDVGISVDTCASLGLVANNLFANHAANKTLTGGTCTGDIPRTATDITMMQSFVNGTANIQLAAQCSQADQTAVPAACLGRNTCPGPSCPSGLLTQFGFNLYQAGNIPANGARDVWNLTDATPCRVTKGGIVLSGSGSASVVVPTDFAGAARPPTAPSIGAWQQSGACAAP